MNRARGSGTFVGISTLAQALQAQGHVVDIIASGGRWPLLTLERLWFNWTLRRRQLPGCDVEVGFDLDGYALPKNRPPHVACIKGVIADELRFEEGLSRLLLEVQAERERRHIVSADLVITTSRYSAARVQELYGLRSTPVVVPELIDLRQWRREIGAAEVRLRPGRFVVLAVAHLYPRKRLDLLVRAAALLRNRIPELEVRIAGDGPEAGKLTRLASSLGVDRIVTWLGHVEQSALVSEYVACDVFALPSMQEGFGIVFLEAMAAGKPVVAAAAGAVPEVVPHGVLAEPGSAEALAAAIEELYGNEAKCQQLGRAGAAWVEQFDAPAVARQFASVIDS